MLTNTHLVTVEWGHCDPAGIVYFPNYFTYFDAGTNALFLRALGCNKFEMLKRYGIVGIPLVDVGARFMVPSTFGDIVASCGLADTHCLTGPRRFAQVGGLPSITGPVRVAGWGCTDPGGVLGPGRTADPGGVLGPGRISDSGCRVGAGTAGPVYTTGSSRIF